MRQLKIEMKSIYLNICIIMGNNVRKKSNRQPKGDFSFIKDENSRKALHNLYMGHSIGMLTGI